MGESWEMMRPFERNQEVVREVSLLKSPRRRGEFSPTNLPQGPSYAPRSLRLLQWRSWIHGYDGVAYRTFPEAEAFLVRQNPGEIHWHPVIQASDARRKIC
jgi:hypothetical protein